jgi:hypothetical protein
MKNNYPSSIFLLLLVLAISNLSNGQIIADGTYKILNTVNSQVVSINTLAVGDPNNPDDLIVGRAQMAAPDSADNVQLWAFAHQGNDVYKITNVGDNTILGIKDGWCGDFGDVQVGFDATSPYTLFKVTASAEPNSYVFEIAFDSACNFGSTNTPIKSFDIDGGNSNGKLQTFPVDTANPNQQFQIVDPVSLSLENIDRLNVVDFTYNKANRNLNITNVQNTNFSSVRVFDMNGRLITTVEESLTSSANLDFNSFTNGIYFVAVEIEGSKTVEKILVH